MCRKSPNRLKIVVQFLSAVVEWDATRSQYLLEFKLRLVSELGGLRQREPLDLKKRDGEFPPYLGFGQTSESQDLIRYCDRHRCLLSKLIVLRS